MHRSRSVVLALLVVASSLATVGLAASGPTPPGSATRTGVLANPGSDGLQTFNSSADFAAYRKAAADRFGTPATDGRVVFLDGGRGDLELTLATPGTSDAGDGVRVSSTNVQEAGIDEPDLVKTDGEYAYYSPGGRFPRYASKAHGTTRVVDLRPATNASQVAGIDDAGRLLRVDDTLVVVGDDAVTGYSVADPNDPTQVWNRSLDGRVVAGRLTDGTLFLVVASGLPAHPCPVEPLAGVNTDCTDVYHPDALVPVAATYTALSLDPATGDPGDSVSFVGSRDSTVYMGGDSLYVATASPPARGHLLLDVLTSDASDLLPDEDVAHLRDVRGYDLSDRAVAAEANHVLARYLGSLPTARRKAVNDQFETRYREYTADHRRNLTTTHVVRVDVPSLSVAASGTVPGAPLNQFSMDVREGNLRIATTVSAPRMRWRGANTSTDVSVLDESLDVVGSVQGMSDGQRVYAVRFVGDRGYVVTYRRVDPLHVVDLSDPANPAELGALELPGFSRYLHPLSGDRLLGIGEEDGRVKTAIFDVSDPTDPRVEASRVLDASYSGVEASHHAFLLDERHGAFVLPTPRGARVLSTTDLSTKTSVDLRGVQRAVYVGDDLFLFAPDRVAVVNETTWQRVRTVPLT